MRGKWRQFVGKEMDKTLALKWLRKCVGIGVRGNR